MILKQLIHAHHVTLPANTQRSKCKRCYLSNGPILFAASPHRPFPFRSSTSPSSTPMLSISVRVMFQPKVISTPHHNAFSFASSTASAGVGRLKDTVQYGTMAAIYESMYARYPKVPLGVLGSPTIAVFRWTCCHPAFLFCFDGVYFTSWLKASTPPSSP